MSKLADTDNTDFVIALGDNFYGTANASDHGVSSVQDSKWTYDWLEIYNGTRMNELVWYALPGNHDWYQNITAQIEYSKVNERWYFPDFFYTKSFTVDGSKVDFVFISTDLIYFGYDGSASSGYQGGNGTATKNNMKDNFVKLGWTKENDTLNKQLQWINNTLYRSDADYLIVASHYDAVTCNGTIPNMQPLVDILTFNNVSAYMYGHAHELGYKKQENTLFLQSGAGGRSESCTNTNGTSISTASWITSKVYGYANVHLNATLANVDFYNQTNGLLQSIQFGPRPKRDQGPILFPSSASYYGMFALIVLLFQ
ncbi:Metallo-dependent phosphatase-like protein [Gorgonomyces haynaldii]|nr:Metallo-dependent phosphatase-like protein [Gorgonomyces haynaldii]